MASFADAGVHSSGETQQETYENGKELILDIFDQLSSVPAARLGPGPARQLAVLREYLDERSGLKLGCFRLAGPTRAQ